MRRLTPATLTLIMFGVMGLLVAAYIAKTLLARETPPPAAPAVRNMPLPLGDIPAGTEITEKHIGMGPVRTSELEPDMLAANRAIVGRVAKVDLKKAVPIKAGMLYEPGQRPPLKVSPGMQAVTIEVASTPALVDGLLRPNEYCDVHINLQAVANYQGLEGGAALTLLKSAHIIAINGSVVQKAVSQGGNTVTLELTPEHARFILFMQNHGVMWTSYTPVKGPTQAIVSDLGDGPITAARVWEAMGFHKPPPVVPVPAPPGPTAWRVHSYHGLSHKTVQFYSDGTIAYNQYQSNAPSPNTMNNGNPGLLGPGIPQTSTTPPDNGTGTLPGAAGGVNPAPAGPSAQRDWAAPTTTAPATRSVSTPAEVGREQS